MSDLCSPRPLGIFQEWHTSCLHNAARCWLLQTHWHVWLLKCWMLGIQDSLVTWQPHWQSTCSSTLTTPHLVSNIPVLNPSMTNITGTSTFDGRDGKGEELKHIIIYLLVLTWCADMTNVVLTWTWASWHYDMWWDQLPHSRFQWSLKFDDLRSACTWGHVIH